MVKKLTQPVNREYIWLFGLCDLLFCFFAILLVTIFYCHVTLLEQIICVRENAGHKMLWFSQREKTHPQ